MLALHPLDGVGISGMSAANTVVENGGRVVLLVIWLEKHL